MQYQLILSHDLGYLNREDFAHLSRQANEVKRMLTAFIARVKDRMAA
jgi:four helix bundle protein